MTTQMTEADYRPRRAGFLVELLRISMIASALFAAQLGWSFINRSELLVEPGKPFGADFINLWAAGLLILSGDFGQIYVSSAFASFQQSLVGEYIGQRMWAYPPHSLLFVWPFGLTGLELSFAIWSALGLLVLGWGARRFGFGWHEVGILMLCPAAAQSILSGQSGNLICGLLLLALADDRGRQPAFAAALLTIKPQAGFLIPLLWIIRRSWSLIGLAAIGTILMVAASIVLFGTQSWIDYAGDTLRELSDLERRGRGPFMYLIPSAFMSLRLLGWDGDTAMLVHASLAAIVFVTLAFILSRASRSHQAGLLMIGTALITPYLHLYDVTILLAGTLVMLRTDNGASVAVRQSMCAAVCIAWSLPLIIIPLGKLGAPISPLLIVAIFAFACWQALAAPADVKATSVGSHT